MALLIDKPLWQFRGEKWSHLVSDESYDELHGLPRNLEYQDEHSKEITTIFRKDLGIELLN